MLTTLVGRPVSELDTPALLIDLDLLERNIAKMSADMRARGVAWRPHEKGHKCPAITHKELAAGAIGVTCAKLGEAEVMAAAGVRDILVANQVVGPIKARRLAALAAQVDIMVAVDSIENVRELDAAARAHGTHPRALIEVNVGMNRCGTEPGEATVALAREVAACEGLRFAGLMGYEGHCMDIADPVERAAKITDAIQRLTSTATACRDAGLPVEIVSCGGTGTYLTSVAIPGITEIQAGGGIFGDAFYRGLGVEVAPSLTLLTQVVSRPAADRIIVDAGRKTIDPSSRKPQPRGIDGIKEMAFSAEHGRISLDHGVETPRVGDRIEWEIGYHDQVVHLHENLYGIRDGIIETIWPVAARGRLQ